MQYPWMNNGEPFTPSLKLGEFEDFLEAQVELERELHESDYPPTLKDKISSLRHMKQQVDLITSAFQHVDPSVTREDVRNHLDMNDIDEVADQLLDGNDLEVPEPVNLDEDEEDVLDILDTPA